MKRIIKSDPPPYRKISELKKEQPVRFEPKQFSLRFSNPPRYRLS